MSPPAALGLLVVTLVVLVAGLVTLDSGRQQRRVASQRASLRARRSMRPWWLRAVDAAARRTPVGRSVDDRLRRAGQEGLVTGDVVGVALLAAAGVILLASRLVTLPAAVIIAVAGLVAADRYLDHLVRKRAEAFAEQLADIARLLSNAASAGMAIPNALALSARELEPPASDLLTHAVRQLSVGQTLAGAMAELQERAPSRELAVLVSTLVIQQRTGGDVIEALREMSVNLEVRRDLRREVRTVMSGVKFTAYAVMGLGVVMLFMLEVIAAGTLRRMTATLAGQVILIVAALLYGLGGVAIRRLSRVDL